MKTGASKSPERTLGFTTAVWYRGSQRRPQRRSGQGRRKLSRVSPRDSEDLQPARGSGTAPPHTAHSCQRAPACRWHTAEVGGGWGSPGPRSLSCLPVGSGSHTCGSLARGTAGAACLNLPARPQDALGRGAWWTLVRAGAHPLHMVIKEKEGGKAPGASGSCCTFLRRG